VRIAFTDREVVRAISAMSDAATAAKTASVVRRRAFVAWSVVIRSELGDHLWPSVRADDDPAAVLAAGTTMFDRLAQIARQVTVVALDAALDAAVARFVAGHR
jgi:hypothetical protein